MHMYPHTHRQQVASFSGWLCLLRSADPPLQLSKGRWSGGHQVTRGQQNIPFWGNDDRGTPVRGGTASKAGRQRPERASLHPSRGEDWGPLRRQDQQGKWATDPALPTSQGSVHRNEGRETVKRSRALRPLRPLPPISHLGRCPHQDGNE